MPGREDPNDVKSLPGTDASTKVPSDLGQPGRRSIKSIVLRDLPLLGLVVVGLVVLAVIAMRDLPTIEAGGDTDVEESTDESSPETTEGEEEAAGPSEPEEDPDQDSAAESESESEGADDEGESQSEAGEETEADEVLPEQLPLRCALDLEPGPCIEVIASPTFLRLVGRAEDQARVDALVEVLQPLYQLAIEIDVPVNQELEGPIRLFTSYRGAPEYLQTIVEREVSDVASRNPSFFGAMEEGSNSALTDPDRLALQMAITNFDLVEGEYLQLFQGADGTSVTRALNTEDLQIEAALRRLIDTVMAAPQPLQPMHVEAQGHASGPPGTNNMAYSLERAEGLVEYLGTTEPRLRQWVIFCPVGYAETRPREPSNPNSSENIRVELFALPAGRMCEG